MQQYNFMLVAALAALIPMIMGMIWYAGPVFGKAWMNTNRFSNEQMKSSGGKMAMTFILAYILCFMVAFVLSGMVIHQMALMSLVANHHDAASHQWVMDAMTNLGGEFRTFKHGALHGTITGIFLAVPVIGIITLFEKRGFKYFAIHAGYWIISLALMGGVICQFADINPFMAKAGI